MHLVIEYKPDDSTNNGFLITKTSMNIIYGKWEPATTGELATIQRKTSVKFVQNANSRENSGSPGYLKGKNLKTGVTNTMADAIMKTNGVTQDTKGLINEPIGGFYLRGADNTGECYKIQNTIRVTKDVVIGLESGF